MQFERMRKAKKLERSLNSFGRLSSWITAKTTYSSFPTMPITHTGADHRDRRKKSH